MKIDVAYRGTGAKTIGRTVEGAGVGGLVGVLLGWLFGKPLEGALAGALIGATVGGVSGYSEERKYLENHTPQGSLDVTIRKKRNYLIEMEQYGR